MALFASISTSSLSTSATQIPRPLKFKRRILCPLATLSPPSPESSVPSASVSSKKHPSTPLVESSGPPPDSSFNYSLANSSANPVVHFLRSTESNIERTIFDFRFLALLAVVGSLAGSLLCFLNGCVYIVDAYKVYWTSCVKGVHTGQMVLRLVEAIDVYLAGTVMLIFGMGLYGLFICNVSPDAPASVDRALKGSSLFGMFALKERPKWMKISSLDELKTKVGHVIVMILLVKMFERSKMVTIATGVDLLSYSVCIFLSSASLYILHNLHKSHHQMLDIVQDSKHMETSELEMIMGKVPILGLILAILDVLTGEFGCNGDTLYKHCSLSDVVALTDFKNGLEDPENRLSSWKGTNCCQWRGIGCDNTTGAVIAIDLHNPYPVSSEGSSSRYGYWNLSGEIRPSLLKLKSLQYLDLSLNTFDDIPIPEFLGSLRSLRYLNLSEAGFSGAYPPNLGNLSSLQFLDVSSPFSGLTISSLEWVKGLVSLKHLAMDGVDLSIVGSNWVEVLNMLPRLAEIHLSNCGLSGSILSLSPVNFTSLSVIDLSFNFFNSMFPDWLVNISSLSYLDLSSCSLYGRIPLGFSELPNLRYLSLAMNNNLSASCSQLFRGSWENIEVLDFATNKLHGKLPSSIGNMSSLTNFDLFSNSVEGGIPSSIGKLCNLKNFDLSGNNLTGSLPEILERANCVSNNPLSSLIYLRLSGNRLVGNLPEWLGHLENLAELSLDDNMIQGPIPVALGPIPQNLTESMPDLIFLSLSSNQLTGDIPASIGDMLSLQVIDLSHNSLAGSIPSSIGNCSFLKALDLSHNSISGVIPESLGQLNQLQSLHLSSNNLTGNFPLSLQNLSSLETLDLGNNRLSGNIPLWIGGGFPELRILSLRLNAFAGEIPSSLSNLRSLQVLDLADNNLTGAIPVTLGDLEAMSKEQYINQYLLYGKYRGLYYEESYVMNIKGGPQKYTKTLSLGKKTVTFCTQMRISVISMNKKSIALFSAQELTSGLILLVHVMGLYCLVDGVLTYAHKALLWNSSIRQIVKLPEPNFTLITLGFCMHSLGLGFYSITEDYKLVGVVYEERGDFDEVPPFVEVYSLPQFLSLDPLSLF
ncbi:unnamed protein product [Dovyalis caffra]|uniref:Leucine-rich repeat-containing N-terminal plant-type domain-containing protein n=1 Tax=Dovyalis caffra TaxID=77055 RepID=A0AAV1R8Y4_9ROSI|nr:unnamed protein product [Dovyalis caffra]